MKKLFRKVLQEKNGPQSPQFVRFYKLHRESRETDEPLERVGDRRTSRARQTRLLDLLGARNLDEPLG